MLALDTFDECFTDGVQMFGKVEREVGRMDLMGKIDIYGGIGTSSVWQVAVR